MRRKSNKGRNRSAANHVHVGVVARLVDRAFDDPAMSSGLFVMGLTAMAIVSNAMFLQPSRHPEPLFQSSASQRPVAGKIDIAATAETVVPQPRVRQLPDSDPVAVLVAAQTPTPTVRPEIAGKPDAHAVLVTGLQRELARLGLYSGVIDGISGPRTKAAISRYQAAARTKVTGEPTTELLKLLMAPLPSDPVGPGAASAQRASEDLAALQRRSIATMEHDRFVRIQAALNKIGYGPLDVDGRAGTTTINAIHRFELDQGMEVRGIASDLLITRLVAIGALEPT